MLQQEYCIHSKDDILRERSLIMTWGGSANYRGVIIFWGIPIGGVWIFHPLPVHFCTARHKWVNERSLICAIFYVQLFLNPPNYESKAHVCFTFRVSILFRVHLFLGVYCIVTENFNEWPIGYVLFGRKIRLRAVTFGNQCFSGGIVLGITLSISHLSLSLWSVNVPGLLTSCLQLFLTSWKHLIFMGSALDRDTVKMSFIVSCLYWETYKLNNEFNENPWI